ncbi:MAG: energy-coupling factor ABC transporter ATP-binding protein [Methanomassiliicoccales archaeon]|nr:energy-coupling factor ABC transporter ATP-binding protein [Methanomassiliicoccales archaeon]
MDPPILETKNLSYEYSNRTLALDDVSMTIPTGKKTIILGSNGSGKSTLFLQFNGVLRPKKGDVYFAGARIDYGSKALTKLREQVSVVLQNPDDQIFSTTVEEDVAFGPMNLGLDREEVNRRVDEALFLVDLESIRERPTQQLSFGQRKRVALAGALAMKPKVLMMDEPTAGLDSRMVHELLELADELNQKGLTVLMSTHDVETSYEWADELRVLHRGRLMYSGLPEGFFEDQRRVHSLDLTRPMLFDMNVRLRSIRGDAEAPFPHTSEEMLQKVFPDATRKVGTVYLVKVVVQPYQHPQIPPAPNGEGSKMAVGVYGTMARRWAHDNGMKVDYGFNALEHCAREVSMGKDFVILVDDALVPLVKEKLAKLGQDFGLRVPLSTV